MVERYSIITAIRNVAKVAMPQGSRMLLFGSQAREDANESSDWDLLILLDKERVMNADFDEVAYPFVELGWRLGLEINPLLYTFADWEKRSFTPFYKNVQKDRIELWH